MIDLTNAKRIGTVDDGEFWKLETGNVVLVSWDEFERGNVKIS